MQKMVLFILSGVSVCLYGLAMEVGGMAMGTGQLMVTAWGRCSRPSTQNIAVTTHPQRTPPS